MLKIQKCICWWIHDSVNNEVILSIFGMIDNDLNEVRIVEKNLNKKLEEKLKETEKEEDILLFFLYFIEEKIPLLHFLSNIVLMIWLSQTVLSSNLKQVPRSLYLISPLFVKQPFENLEPSSDGRCPSNYEKIHLGSLPSTQRPKLLHQSISHWKDSSLIICAQRLKYVHLGETCPQNYSKCSGYCVSPVHSCPVTGIRMLQRIEDKHAYETLFYENASPKFYMVLSRLDGKPIIDLMTFINETCANQYYYNDEFVTLKDLTDQIAKGCQEEGNLDDITQLIDTQPFKALLKTNGYIYSDEAAEKINDSLTAKLCYVQKLKFHEDNPYCKAIMSKAFTLPSMLPLSPFLPESKLLLVTGLIYMVFSLIWWVTYTCGLNRFRKEAAIILSAIELMHFIIIKSKYSRYLAINGLNEIQNCVKNNLEALRHWQYGISNPYIFKVVVFENTVFLSFEILCLILLRILYHEV